MQRYFYDGPVTKFGNCIDERWKGSTYARTEKEAKRNLIYHCKVDHNLLPTAQIALPGKIITAN